MGLEIGLKGIPLDAISDLGYLKLHKYNKFDIDLLEGKKKYAFKDHCNKENTSTFKGKSATTRYV